jgi:L-asparaginase
VRKTSNLGMDTFRSPDLGPIGLLAGLEPRILRRPLHRAGPQSAFAGATISTLPRVDILYCHSGADAVAARAFIAAGARAIVLAGMPPGYPAAAQVEDLSRWCRQDGGIVVYASRADGPTVPNARNLEAGFLPSAGLSPVKARLLLGVALACGREKMDLPAIFREH